VLVLAREMLALAGVDADPAAVLAAGRALATWDALVRAQGGDPDAPLPTAPCRHLVRAPATGFVRRLDARAVGGAVWRLGGGRRRVRPHAGRAGGGGRAGARAARRRPGPARRRAGRPRRRDRGGPRTAGAASPGDRAHRLTRGRSAGPERYRAVRMVVPTLD